MASNEEPDGGGSSRSPSTGADAEVDEAPGCGPGISGFEFRRPPWARRPRLLDLFCGAGGAAVGYHRAGFDVVGVDIQPQPRYPFEFHQADALAGQLEKRFGRFDAIHASPPCQAYSALNAYNQKIYPDLISITRKCLLDSGVPYVIENVPGAPLHNPVELCGNMFDLRIYRHRRFESSFFISSPFHPAHKALCVRNGYLPTTERPFMSIHGGKHSLAWLNTARAIMGVSWMMSIREVCESIPPAYTEFVGKWLIAACA